MTSDRPWRRDAFALCTVLIVLSLTWMPRLRGPIDLRGDAALYYGLGTSLAAGHGYRMMNEPGHIEATVWPPLVPAFVAAHQRILHTTVRGSPDITVRRRGVRLQAAHGARLESPALQKAELR